MTMLGQVWLPDGDEPAEWIDLRRERERKSRRVDRRQRRGDVQRRWMR